MLQLLLGLRFGYWILITYLFIITSIGSDSIWTIDANGYWFCPCSSLFMYVTNLLQVLLWSRNQNAVLSQVMEKLAVKCGEGRGRALIRRIIAVIQLLNYWDSHFPNHLRNSQLNFYSCFPWRLRILLMKLNFWWRLTSCLHLALQEFSLIRF